MTVLSRSVLKRVGTAAVVAGLAATTAVAFADTASAAPHPAKASLAKTYAVGDSVMIDAESSLKRDIHGIVVNADVSRQVSTGIAIMQQRKRNHQINDRTVFGLGTNGAFSAAQLRTLINLTRGRKLFVVTSHCPYCSWTDSNNRMINQVCTVHNHCWVAAFQAKAIHHPEWFTGDGVHMYSDSAGARAYASVVRYAIYRSNHPNA